MMRIRYGFSTINLVTLISLKASIDLSKAWSEVEEVAPAELNAATPPMVAFKTMLLMLFVQAVRATSRDEEVLSQVDGRWDRIQRRWALALQSALFSSDAQDQAAAQALSDATLSGSGTEQTNWTYEREVEWGRFQAEQLSQGNMPAYVDRLHLREIAREMLETTEELARAIGRDSNEATMEARWAFERRVQRELAIVLNATMGYLDTMSHYTRDEEARAQLKALRAPLAAVLGER
jgi:hypothetical protein